MPLQYLSHLSDQRRDLRSDRHLGCVLAFVAGAVNAGGFLAIGFYTSHMTGIVSSMADDLALGNFTLALAALAAWLAFLLGAATTALLINFARRRRRNLRSQYALSLLLESALLLLFGLAGAHMAGMPDFMAPVTVLLLCFIMGLQNAIITKVSGATIRTTHLTGMSTDMGIELGKLVYYNRQHRERIPRMRVLANRDKLKLHAMLIGFFFIGGVSGALGFKHIGYSATVILAAVLAALAAGPILHDMRLIWRYYRPKL
ncbi:MAG: uncharacterized membrane protein YoaK (UPF0700 family) [Janthinobacterium sp.]|jgi:uncharacterized membrane protein YoaK (UPF0700 family)